MTPIVAVIGWVLAIVFLCGAFQLLAWLIELEDSVERWYAELAQRDKTEPDGVWWPYGLSGYERRTPRGLRGL